MYTQAKIFNIALSALLLQRRIIDTTTDRSNENQVLLTHYDTALNAALEDMDLDSTSTRVTLELFDEAPSPEDEDPDEWAYPEWNFAYKYPSKCAFFRRICSNVARDTRSTHIPKLVAMMNDTKVILTNQAYAQADIIRVDFPISSLSTNAGLAVAHKLASLAAPLIVGKGALRLMQEIDKKYVFYKTEAQERDRSENFNFETDEESSEFVEARLE